MPEQRPGQQRNSLSQVACSDPPILCCLSIVLGVAHRVHGEQTVNSIARRIRWEVRRSLAGPGHGEAVPTGGPLPGGLARVECREFAPIALGTQLPTPVFPLASTRKKERYEPIGSSARAVRAGGGALWSTLLAIQSFAPTGRASRGRCAATQVSGRRALTLRLGEPCEAAGGMRSSSLSTQCFSRQLGRGERCVVTPPSLRAR